MSTQISQIAPVFELEGYTARPSELGGFWCCQPGMVSQMFCHATTLEVAIEQIKERSGYNRRQLPVLKRSELQVKEGPKIKMFPNGAWYKHTHYWLGDRRLGSIQVSRKRVGMGRFRVWQTTVLTLPASGSCIIAGSLKWLVEQEGFQYVDDVG